VLLIGVNLVIGRIGSSPPYFRWESVEPLDLLAAFSIASRGFTGVDAIGQLAGGPENLFSKFQELHFL
jgi:APA family basic amino acid/polyamine antiporter